MDLQTKVSDLLRLPLAIMVVLLHTTNYDLVYSPVYSCGDIAEKIASFVKGAYHLYFGNAAVPAFFFLSGFLYFYSVGKEKFTLKTYKNKTYRRIFTLLIPYFVWNALFLIVHILHHHDAAQVLTIDSIPHLFWDYNSWGHLRTDVLGNPQPLTGPFLGVLWFIRDLMVVSLISPLVWFLVKRTSFWGVALLGVLYASYVWPAALSAFVNGGGALFWFTFGAQFSVNGVNFVKVFKSLRWPAAICALVTFSYGYLSFISGISFNTWYLAVCVRIFVISFVICIFNVAAYIADKCGVPSSDLGKASYFVYLAHFFILYVAIKPSDYFVSHHLFIIDTITWPIFAAIIVALCLAAHWFLRHHFPWVLKISLGQNYKS